MTVIERKKLGRPRIHPKKEHKTQFPIPARNKAIRAEALRQQLQGSEYLRLIHQILARPSYARDEIETVKIKLDGYFKLLRKVLPDLSEVKAHVESTTVSLEDRVRARNLGLAVEEYIALREVRQADLPAPIAGEFTKEDSTNGEN